MTDEPKENPPAPPAATASDRPSKVLDTILIVAANGVVVGLLGWVLVWPLTIRSCAGTSDPSPVPFLALPLFASLIGVILSGLLLRLRKRYAPLQKYALGLWICLIGWAASLVLLPAILLVWFFFL
jgi:hypothetical protein